MVVKTRTIVQRPKKFKLGNIPQKAIGIIKKELTRRRLIAGAKNFAEKQAAGLNKGNIRQQSSEALRTELKESIINNIGLSSEAKEVLKETRIRENALKVLRIKMPRKSIRRDDIVNITKWQIGIIKKYKLRVPASIMAELNNAEKIIESGRTANMSILLRNAEEINEAIIKTELGRELQLFNDAYYPAAEIISKKYDSLL